MEYFSPLRFPGGKGKLTDYFKQVFKSNDLSDAVYIEPFAGGAAVGLSLLCSEYASSVMINDLDYSIFAFWHSAIYDTEQLCKKVVDTPVIVDEWFKQKAVQRNPSDHGLLDVGFSTLFLNRTNRSGILNAGIIGGKNQDGKWKIDARFNKKEMVKRIDRIGRYQSRLSVTNLDGVEFLKTIRSEFTSKTFVYLDPPYYFKGRDLYLNSLKEDDHRRIRDSVSNIEKAKWIITYDSTEFIKGLYCNFNQAEYSLSYCAREVRCGQEVMIFSNNLIRPKVYL